MQERAEFYVENELWKYCALLSRLKQMLNNISSQRKKST